MLLGPLVSSVQLEISTTHLRGVGQRQEVRSAGEFRPDHAKGCDTHKNAVTGGLHNTKAATRCVLSHSTFLVGLLTCRAVVSQSCLEVNCGLPEGAEVSCLEVDEPPCGARVRCLPSRCSTLRGGHPLLPSRSFFTVVIFTTALPPP